MGRNGRGGRRTQRKKQQPSAPNSHSQRTVIEGEVDANYVPEDDPDCPAEYADGATDEEPTDQIQPFHIRFPGEGWEDINNYLEHEARLDVKIRTVNDGSVLEVLGANRCDQEELKKFLKEYVVEEPDTPLPAKSSKKKRPTIVKALLRGLPWQFSEEMVRKGLEYRGFTDVGIRLHNRTNRTKPPLYVLAVDPAKHMWRTEAPPDLIYDVDELLGIEVKIEPLPAELDRKPQCYRCQEVGHVARYCRGLEVCVKCAGKHASRTCTAPREEKPTCARCGGDHVASWRGCKAFASSRRTEKRKTGEKKTASPASAADGTPKKRRRRRKRRGKTSSEGTGSGASSAAPPARPGAAPACGRGGGKTRLSTAERGQSAPSHRDDRTAAPSSDPSNERSGSRASAAASTARPGAPPSCGRGEGEARPNAASRGQTAPCHREERSAATSSEPSTGMASIIALKEAEAHFREMLQTEMKAACSAIKQAARSALMEIAKQRSPAEEEETTQPRRVAAAVQTVATARRTTPTQTQQTTERRPETAAKVVQTVEVVGAVRTLMTVEEREQYDYERERRSPKKSIRRDR